MQYNLTIVIPSLNEEWLGETVKDVLKHTSDRTEIIVVLDGWKPEFELPKSDRLKIISLEKTVGQRAAQNIGVRESTAKYVSKLDSHVSLSDNWDSVMLEIMETNPNIVLVPALGNLYVYDWVCPLKHRSYQGKRDKCEQCSDTNLTKELVWKIQPKLYSDFYFDKDLIFQFGSLDKIDMLSEVSAIQGSGFMVSRDNYWKWNLCDESWGSWGQQGVEVYTKTIKNGGKVMATRKAYMGHFFRKIDEFPYSRDMAQVDMSYEKSKELAESLKK